MTDQNASAEALLEGETMTEQDICPQEGESVPEENTDASEEAGEAALTEPVQASSEPESAEMTADSTAVGSGEATEDATPEAAPDDQASEEGMDAKIGPGEELSDEELLQGVSALIFASPDPLGLGRLVNLLERPRSGRVKGALTEIQSRLERAGLPLELREIAGGWRLMTSPAVSETVASLVKARKNEKLSPAGLETLAVIAYRQPVTKAEVEAIRGVQCGAMLRTLVDRGLAKVVGRADVPGGPLQYGTSKEFLDRFGMASLKDLPRDGELLKE